MPDFDIDFCQDGRDRVIDYVKEKYGAQCVSQIATFGTMAAKAVVRDVGRVLSMPYGEVDRIAKLIPFEIGMTLEKALTVEPQLKELMQQQSKCSVHGHNCHEGLFARNLFIGQRIPLAGVAHQVGTARFGKDPRTSVLDTNCKAHDLDNLYVVDGSFFVSSGAVNPALTIMANALRVGEHLSERLK